MTNGIILLAILLAFSFFVGLVIESYKKLIRDDKYNAIEVRVIAFLVSVAMGFVCYEVVDMRQITTMIRDSIWVALAYGVLIYVGQYETCMKLWKPLIKKWIRKRIDG